MYVMTSGDRNISIGNDSSYALTDGDDNLVIGYQAGDEITTGDNIPCYGRVTTMQVDQLAMEKTWSEIYFHLIRSYNN